MTRERILYFLDFYMMLFMHGLLMCILALLAATTLFLIACMWQWYQKRIK